MGKSESGYTVIIYKEHKEMNGRMFIYLSVKYFTVKCLLISSFVFFFSAGVFWPTGPAGAEHVLEGV